MSTIILAVGLKIPDMVAFTALQTLKERGFALESLERKELFLLRFEEGIDVEACKQKLLDCDLLVNVNKNTAFFISHPDEGILVREKDQDNASLIRTLQQNFGIQGLLSLQKITYWLPRPSVDNHALSDLLFYNKQYQDVEIR